MLMFINVKTNHIPTLHSLYFCPREIGKDWEDVAVHANQRVFKSVFLSDVNILYTYDTHQREALLICRQKLFFFHRDRLYQ